MMTRVTIYRWAVSRQITPQTAYRWRKQGLPTDSAGRVDPAEADDWLSARKKRTQTRNMAVGRSNQPILEVDELRAREPEAICRSFASLNFLRAQGRTLAKGSQELFCAFALKEVTSALHTIVDLNHFQQAHHAWVNGLCKLLTTNTGASLKYGQGQKSLNVFLKFYVDWASQPNSDCAEKLRPWLHCPLDRVVMRWLANKWREEYKKRILPCYPGVRYQQRYSLSKMDEPVYKAWQAWIRCLAQDKPVLLDLVWTFERTAN